MKRTVEEVIELLKADQVAIVNSTDGRFDQVKCLIELVTSKRLGVAYRWVMNEEDAEDEDNECGVFSAKVHPDVYDFLVRENKFLKKNIKITLRKGMEKRAAEGFVYEAQLSPDTSPELMTRTLNAEVENAVREWIKQFLDITMDAPPAKPAKKVEEEDDSDDDEIENAPVKKPLKRVASPFVPVVKDGAPAPSSVVKQNPLPFSDIVELVEEMQERLELEDEIRTDDDDGDPRDANDVIRDIIRVAKGWNEGTKKYDRHMAITKDDMLSVKSCATLLALGYEVK